ncbi:MAG: DNA translocase FtsK [Bacteroidales bacterium]
MAHSNNSIISILKDERTRIIVGIIMLSSAIFFTLSFTSFIFTWEQDHSELLQKNSWDYLFSTEKEVVDPALEDSQTNIEHIEDNEHKIQNWGGRFGALVSKKFIHDWFGISSFVFIFIFLITGLRLFNIRFVPVKKTIAKSLISILVFSITFGYAFSNTWDANVGGFFGYYISHIFLADVVGIIPAGLFVFILFSVYILFTFKNALPIIKHIFSSQEQDENQNSLHNTDEDDTIHENSQEEETTARQENEDTISQPIDLDDTKKNEEETEDIEEKSDNNFEVTDSRSEEEYEEKQPQEQTSAQQEHQEHVDDMEITNAREQSDASDHISTELHDYDPTLDLSHYKLPHIDLLENHQTSTTEVSSDELTENKKKIEKTLKDYNIKIEKISATIGPTITLYEIVPAPGVRISKIKNLEDDIALSLAALGIRIIAPIPGRGTIGIEVPNKNPETVSFRSIIASKNFQESKHELPVGLGKTISNETYVFDLAKTPHLLVAGATGQGKSVGLNAILASLLYKKHPAQLKFVLIDPKKVELTLFQNIENHFLAKLPDEEEAIITDTQKVVATLNSLCIEMDNRYDLLKQAKLRNIKEYNEKFIKRKLNPEKGHKYLPYIVVVIDEFSDLIITAGKEVETPLMRLAQLARAIGIHLIIATQRPAANIITGGIKANFPSRIAFRVMSSIDSRTILDISGANQLIGKGDMLITTGSSLVRLQCAFIDTPEISSVTDFISEQQAYPSAHELPEYKGNDSASGSGMSNDADSFDPMYEDAARVIVMNQQGSTSLIQRKLKLGYNRAGRIMDQLEASGVVGPFEGSKARQVLIPDELGLEQLLEGLKQQGKI